MVRYDCKIKKYIVAEFVREHNHTMIIREHITFLRSHRNVIEGDLAQVRTFQSIGEGTSQIMKSFVFQEGGTTEYMLIEGKAYWTGMLSVRLLL